jgi:hypothetical protein
MNYLETLKKKYKVIIWGFKPNSQGIFKNTVGYVWKGFYNGFKALGFDTYWFSDEDYDPSLDYSNCIFIVEAWDSNKIPLNKNSIYYVHCAYDPSKYIGKVGKFIDLRYNQKYMRNPNYNFDRNKSDDIKLGPCCYYQESTNKIIHLKNQFVDYDIEDFDKIYISWATDLLPDQMNEDDIFLERENLIVFLGTIYYDHYTNIPEINEFGEVCKKNQVNFLVNPYSFGPDQISSDDYISCYKKSLFGLDLRGQDNIKTGYIPCRVFKNASYGLLSTTNSDEIYNEMEGHCVYNPSVSQLFYDAMEKRNDFDFIKKSFNYVKENHTYINRVTSILKILEGS